jgi:peptidoglycan/xylan/chitin deacetylase (PgdA/CDA1 family)
MTDVLVLCYHAVSERWDADLSITPQTLEDQLEFLVSRGYHGATFTEAVTKPRSGNVLAVTFDDAYRSVLELGFPILARLGLPGSVFVPTDYAGTEQPMSWPGIEQWAGGPFERELVPLSWQEVGRLADAGWEIGSHTRSHPHLTQLDGPSLEAELRGSREACEERLGHPCESLAYPYGDHDRRVVEAAAAAGYRAAGTLPTRFGSRDPLSWPRVGIYFGDEGRRFRLKVSRLVRGLRASRAWEAADRLRKRTPGT